jgi:dTDP-4-amino-4,6-dideoxygalactose transaminase
MRPLADQGRVGVPVVPRDSNGNGHMFYLLLSSPEERADFIAHMKANKIMTPFHYVPLHDSPGGRKYGRVEGPMTETDRVSATLVRLPLFFDLESALDEVIDKVHVFFNTRPRTSTH